ncbi:MAG: ribosome biogenesis GTPase Der [Planctomycetota bacterium]|nr:ribosome biogenesis GTPase Der [Planctomycetota bacterium]
MGLPQVVIVGRPNTGKSSIFNWLVGRRLAIVDNTAGVTRDRMSYLMHHQDHYFELVDTGGMGIEDVDDLTQQIEEQIQVAVDSAAVILFVVDTQAGLMPLDSEVAKKLRYDDTPVICVANKTDNTALNAQADEFYRLGRGKLVRTSTVQNQGKDELLDLIVQRLPEVDLEDQGEPEEAEMKVAIVGRRNVGKSTLINTLAGAERMIVSEIPGTTRDSVDVRFEMDGKSFVAIDTPGLRRSKSIKSDIDFYGLHRARRSIRRADVVLLFFDPQQRISKVDKQLCDYVADQYKPCIFVVNKWDLQVGKMPTEKWANYVHDTFRTMSYAPIAFITGQTGKNVKALLNHAQMLFKLSRKRITTGVLNRVVRAAIQRNPPPLHENRTPKIYYAVQVGTQPPTIVLFCNRPQAFSQPYRRYLLGVMRDHVEFAEVPIKLYLRKRSETDTRDEISTDSGPAPVQNLDDVPQSSSSTECRSEEVGE